MSRPTEIPPGYLWRGQPLDPDRPGDVALMAFIESRSYFVEPIVGPEVFAEALAWALRRPEKRQG